MIRTVHSESLKLKNSYRLYLVIGFGLLQLLTIPSYLYFVPGGISPTDLALLTMLVCPLLVSILSVLSFEQEQLANHLQEIKSYASEGKIWLSKLLVMDGLLIFPTVVVWLWLRNPHLALAAWLLVVFLNHFHMLLNFFVNRSGNILIAIVEVLFIVFASNKVLSQAYWCPIALPVNFALKGELVNILVIIIWICFVTAALILMPKSSQSEKK